MGPQNGAHARPPRPRERRDAEDPVWRPVQRRQAAGGVLDPTGGPVEIVANLPGSQAQEIAMAMAVQADLVAGRDDLSGHAGVARDLLADQEERRPVAVLRERLQDGG